MQQFGSKTHYCRYELYIGWLVHVYVWVSRNDLKLQFLQLKNIATSWQQNM